MYEHTGLLYLQKPKRGDVCSTSRASFQNGPLLWSLCDDSCWSKTLVSCHILGPCCQLAISCPAAGPVTLTVTVFYRSVTSAISSPVFLTAAMLASIAVLPTIIPRPVPVQSSGFRQLRVDGLEQAKDVTGTCHFSWESPCFHTFFVCKQQQKIIAQPRFAGHGQKLILGFCALCTLRAKD